MHRWFLEIVGVKPERGTIFFSVAMLGTAVLASSFATPTKAEPLSDEWAGEVTLSMPPQSGIADGNTMLARYADMPEWHVTAVRTEAGAPDAVTVVLPSPFAQPSPSEPDLPLLSVLPTRPAWYIYRFKYIDLEGPQWSDFPFRYIELDWNTEGLPRGPSDSFSDAHFDFHFYIKSRDFVERKMHCGNDGKTCVSRKTGHAQMRRFLALPEPCFLPESYFPDVASAIPAMGLHNLDSDFEFTRRNVDENAVVIYGTFDNEVVFLETSLTLVAFKKAIEAAQNNTVLEWTVPQPQSYQTEYWPTRVVLRYLTEEDTFAFSYAGFVNQEVSELCG